MVKIIRQGQDPKLREIKATCRNCMTHFSFIELEAKLIHDQREGDYYEIDCPTCNAKVIVQKR